MDELEKLYNVLIREGKYTKSFDEFKGKWSSDNAYRDKVYGVVSRDGLYTKDKGSFMQKYSAGIQSDSLKKKAQPIVSRTGAPGSQLGSMLSPVSKNPNAAQLYETHKNNESAKILTQNIKSGNVPQFKPNSFQEVYNVDPGQYVRAVKQQQEQDLVSEEELAIQEGQDTPNFYVYQGQTYPKQDFFKYQNILIPRDESNSFTAYTNDARQALTNALVKPVGGLLSLVRDGSNKLYKGIYESFGEDFQAPQDISSPDYKETWLTDPIGKSIRLLNESSDISDYLQAKEGLPEKNPTKTLVHAIPLMGMMYMTGGAGRVAGALPTGSQAIGAQTLKSIAAKQIANPLTKALAVQGALTSYGTARKEGRSVQDAFSEGITGGVEGAKSGTVLTAQMGLAHGLVGDIIKSGAPLTAKQLNVLGVGSVFGGTSVANDLMEGKPINMENAWHEFLVGAMFELPAALGESYNTNIGEPIERMKISKKSFAQAVQTKEGAKIVDAAFNANAINNFFNSKPEAIDIAMSVDATPKKIWNKAVKFGEKAYDSKDLAEKNSNYANQLTMQKIGDIKYVTDAIINNKQGFLDAVDKMDLTDVEKADYKERVNDVYNRYSEEGQIKNYFDQAIEGVSAEIKDLEGKLSQAQKPSEKAELNTLIKAKKTQLTELEKTLDAYTDEKLIDDSSKKELSDVVTSVNDFVERYITGEDMTSSEDLQFYENNSQLIEAKLRDYALQESSTSSEVPLTNERGEIITEGGEGVGQRIKGEKVTEEVVPEEEVVKSSDDIRRAISKEIDSQVSGKEKELKEKQNKDIEKAKDDLNAITNGNKSVIDSYVKKSGYKLVTKEVIANNPKSELLKKSEGKYYTSNGASIKVKTAEEIAVESATKKANSKPTGSLAGGNQYVDAYNSISKLAKGEITLEEAKSTIEKAGLIFPKEAEQILNEQKTKQAPQEFISEEVSRLRDKEQAEYAAMKNPNDAVKRKAIYDKYDKPITEAIREAKEKATVKVEDIQLPELNEENLDIAIESATDIADLNKKAKRVTSKAAKNSISKKIKESEAELASLPVEGKIAKGISDNFDAIKKELKDKGLIELKGC